MSYIPPHKRSTSSSTPPCPTPTPHSLQPHFKNHSHSYKKENERFATRRRTIIYAKNAVKNWFPVGLADDSQLPISTHLSPFPLQVYDQRSCEKPLALVLNYHCGIKEDVEVIKELPWDYIVENVQQELLSSFERVKSEIMENAIEEVKPAIVARFGKMIFHGGHLYKEEATVKNLAQQSMTFFTNVPLSYLDYMSNEVVSKLELDFEREKELYLLQLYDKMHPNSMLSCKCIVSKDHERLELHKIESTPERHFVANMSCLAKDLDLRLMLCTKKIMTDFITDEMESIKMLISYATIDPQVKGGLRWPLGKNSSRDRYSICAVAHTTAKTYRNSSIRLKVRQVERFDFRTLLGENTGEVSLKMRGIVSLLKEPTFESELISQMLKHILQLIWEYCLERSASASTQV